MNIITKLPGPLLIFLGACSLSFGGLIVKSFEGAPYLMADIVLEIFIFFYNCLSFFNH